jgi:tetratricopeptide (TPR) repeat protein
VLDWLRFWDALVENRRHHPAEAERLLTGLLDREPEDVRLRLWALGELGNAQASQSRFREARETFEAEVAQGESSQIDRTNLPTSYLRLGKMWQEDRPGRALEPLARGLAVAEEEEARHAIIPTLTEMSRCYASLGRRDDAFAQALEALDRARADPQGDRIGQEVVAEAFMVLLTDEDPALLDTVAQECTALLSGLGDQELLLRHRIAWVDAVMSSGQLSRAQGALAGLSDEVRNAPGSALQVLFLNTKGMLSEALGELGAAVDAYDSCASKTDDAVLEPIRASALHRAGWLRMRMGQLTRAGRDLAAAEESWERQGLDGMAALVRVDRGRLARKLSKLSEARELLDSAAGDLEDVELGFRFDLLLAQAELERRCGRLKTALELSQNAATLAERMKTQSALSSALTAVCVAARESGRWAEASEAAARNADACAALATAAGYRRHVERKRADEENGQGLRSLSGEGFAAATAARDLFRSAAKRVPGESWFRLNLAYACAALGEWKDAIDELTIALRDDERLRCPAIEARLAIFHAEHADVLLSTGQSDDAASFFEEALRILDDGHHPSTRRRALIGLGDSRLGAGDTEGAAVAYREALAAGATDAWARLFEVLSEAGDRRGAEQAAWAAVRGSDADTAVEAASRLLAGDQAPSDPAVLEALQAAHGDDVLPRLGQELEADGSQLAARAVYEFAGPRVPAARVLLGDFLRSAGETGAARRAYEDALASEDPFASPAAAFRIGELLAAAGDALAAVRMYERGLANPDSSAPFAALRLGELRRDVHDVEGAIAAFEMAASDGGTEAPSALVNLGDLHAERGESIAAEDAYRRALQVWDPSVAARAAAGLEALLEREGRQGEVASVMEAVVARGAYLAVLVGDLEREAGRVDVAEWLYSRGSELEGDLWAPDAELRLGDLLAERGQRSRALVAWERAAGSRDAGVVADANLRLADAHAEPPDVAVARVAPLGAQALLQLGEALIERRDAVTAEQALRTAADLPDDVYAPDAALRLGDLLAERGALELARDAYRRAIDSGDAVVEPAARTRLEAIGPVSDP